MITAEAILHFWFGDLDEHGDVIEDRTDLWWRKHPQTDETIKDRFEGHLFRAGRGDLDTWVMSPSGRLALIITFDQFPRNIFRGSSEAFDYDSRALELCLDGIARGLDQQLPLIQRVFFYLPLEHSEDRDLQQRSVGLFTELHKETPEHLESTFRYYLTFAERHKAIIDRFGRFPHRNAVLGRTSTGEELEFLKQPGSSF